VSKTVYSLFVNGVPKPQPRPRKGRYGNFYNPPSADAWKAEIRAAFLQCRRPTITGPVCLRVNFYLPRPKGMKDEGEDQSILHTKKPDADNLLKAVMDAMTQAGVWEDDALVFKPVPAKYYAHDGKTGAQIIVETEF
jgi:Holliday junction resolvase RusA-like endonuclease